jgi:hypothetical protein
MIHKIKVASPGDVLKLLPQRTQRTQSIPYLPYSPYSPHSPVFIAVPHEAAATPGDL